MLLIAALLLLTAASVRAAVVEGRSASTRRRVTSPRRADVELPAWLRRAVDRALRNRRERQLEAALPDALDGMARSLRSGGSLRQAIAEAAHTATGALAIDLARVVRDADDGVPIEAALASWAASRPLPGVRLTTAALALGAETGGASARAVDGVAATLRTNLAIAGEVRALSSQARLSALVIVLAPVAFTALAASTDRRTAGFLLGTPLGLACLAAGVTLDAVGWAWMRRITAAVA